MKNLNVLLLIVLFLLAVSVGYLSFEVKSLRDSAACPKTINITGSQNKEPDISDLDFSLDKPSVESLRTKYNY